MIRKTLLSLVLTLPLFAQVADVRLIPQTGRPTLLDPGDFGDMVLAVQNLGPDVARNLRLEYRVSPGITFTRTDSNCSAPEANVLVCTFGDFAPGVTYAGAEYDMPFATGTFTVTATLLTDSTDPVPGNNSATLTYQVFPAAGVFVSPFARDARIDPGDATIVHTQVLRAPRPRETDLIPAGTVVEAHLSVGNGATIEAVEGPPYWSCTLGGATATCRAVAPGGACCGTLDATVRASQDRAGGTVSFHADAVVQRPSLDLPVAGEASIEVFRHAVVTNVQDAGAGSLRAAIEEVNAHSTQSSRLLFEIPPPVPADGAFTITPSTPLPPIVADRILMDARPETGTAAIVLDGSAAGKGLEIHAGCEGVVRGLTFRNFGANEALWYTAGQPCIRGTGVQFLIERNRFEHNRRGLILDGAPFPRVVDNVISNNRFSGIWMWRGVAWIQYNRIEGNGASGIFLGPEVRDTRILSNTISGNGEMGVAAANGASHIEIGSNVMRGNGGLGIDWGLDGVTPQRGDDSVTATNAPTILSAVYDPAVNQTVVTLTVRSRPLDALASAYVVVEVFSNAGPDGDGEEPVGNSAVTPTDGTPLTMNVRGDLRGKWINATATRAARIGIYARSPIATNEFGDIAWTSELSNAVLAR